jgi:hypothetical protein
MEDGKVRVVWNGNVVRGVPEVLGCVDTTVSNILSVLSSMGKQPNEFNDTIVEAKAKPHLSVPCILWVKGDIAGAVVSNLRSQGLCVEVPSSK